MVAEALPRMKITHEKQGLWKWQTMKTSMCVPKKFHMSTALIKFRRLSLVHSHQSLRSTMTRNFTSHTVRLGQIWTRGAPNSDSYVLSSRNFRYSLRDGETFAEQARHATFDLAGDEGMAAQKRAQSRMTWNKKKKKFVHGDGAGADNTKMVRAESGIKLPASYRSGRFDEWRAKARVSLPRVGEVIPETRPPDRKRFKHASITPPKPLDKLAKNYERKVRVQQKKAEAVGTVAEG